MNSINEKKTADKLSCAIVRDLLPLYHDNVVSDETKSAVTAHIAQCADCAEELEKLDSQLPVEADCADTGEKFRKFSKRQKKKHRLLNVVCFVIGAALVLSGVLYFVRTVNIIPYTPDAFGDRIKLIYHYDFDDGRFDGMPGHDKSYDHALFVYMAEPVGPTESNITRLDGNVDVTYKHPIWNPSHYAMGLHFTINIIPLQEGDKSFSINGKKVYDIGEPDIDLPPYVEAYCKFMAGGGTWYEDNIDTDTDFDEPADVFVYCPSDQNSGEERRYIKWDLEGNVIENTLE